jgi:hypothetical protein
MKIHAVLDGDEIHVVGDGDTILLDIGCVGKKERWEIHSSEVYVTTHSLLDKFKETINEKCNQIETIERMMRRFLPRDKVDTIMVIVGVRDEEIREE